MEAANTAINCCGLHLYNVSRSPEDIKQTYKSILSSSGAWLSPKERPSAQQNAISEGRQSCRALLRALRSATYHFPYAQNNPSFRRQNNPPKHSRKLWSSSQLTFVCTNIPPVDLPRPKGHLGPAPQPHLWSRRSSRCCTHSPPPRCSTAS